MYVIEPGGKGMDGFRQAGDYLPNAALGGLSLNLPHLKLL